MSTSTGRARGAAAPGLAGTLLVVVIGSIMSVLDITIVNVAVHPLAVAFGAPLATVQWVATGYTLALVAVVPAAAWVMDRFGARRAYLTALVLFTLGSVLASLAWSIETLVLFRVLQGLGGGLLMPVGMAMVIRAAERERMGRAMAMLGIPVLVGPVSGPVLGGWLIDAASWHWIFLVNLPVGAVALLLAARLLPPGEPRPARRLDVPGLLMLSPGLALLIYGLSTGGERGDLAAPGVLLPAVAGLLLCAAFVARGLTARDPLLRLRLFRERTFAAGLATMTLFPCGYFGSMLLTPMYYQTVRDLGAAQAGLLGAPLAVAVGVSMQVATRRIDRVSPRLVVVSGIALAVLGLSSFTALLGPDTSYWWLCAAMMLMGTGVGMVMMPVSTAATRNLPADDVPSGSTLLNIVSQVGTSLGTALLPVVLASAVKNAASTTGTAGTTGMAGMVDAAGRTGAFQHTYWWAVALLALAALPALLLPSRRPGHLPTPPPPPPTPATPVAP
ncbi:DHA2 family efflux MFS transporter permease subunit [Streptosporangium sp. NPDC050855]|uniref:DHA2 family efflux MFS transporter permease subunit n=1 Tax=Streptosporangium sp. NPDC050855 TaxID=3366194 RepID=UPI00378D11B7